MKICRSLASTCLNQKDFNLEFYPSFDQFRGPGVECLVHGEESKAVHWFETKLKETCFFLLDVLHI